MLIRPVFIAIVCYLITLGATFNGVILPDVSAMTLSLIGVLLIVWLIGRRKWTWVQTPLDAPLMLWGGVIALSFVLNWGEWRRMLVGIWFVLLYMLIWYVLTDLISHKALRRSTLVDAILLGGGLVLLVGLWQYTNIISSGERYSGFFGLPRASSLIGNPNSLAALLAPLVGFAGGRLISVKGRVWKAVLVLYLFVTLLFLFLTYSRGGWLGGAAAGLIVMGLWAASRGFLNPQRAIAVYRQQTRLVQGGVIGFALILMVSGLLAGIVLVRSFDEGGRSAGLRTYIWNSALTLFNEKPIAGHGLFTFGKGLERLNSSPPLTPHSHAHSVPLNVMAELGILGALALVVTVGVVLWAMRENWQRIEGNERGVLIGGIAAVVGFGVHHLFDMPMMMPAIMLTLLLGLAVACTPVQPLSMAYHWRRIGHGLVMAGLGVALVVSGWWSSRIYADYLNTLRFALISAEYRSGAERLQGVVDRDPAVSVYHWQQGYLYGISAFVEDSTEDARGGIVAFERYLEREPQNAINWANLGALQWQVGEQESALASFQRASDLSERSWQLAVAWGRHAEIAGDTEMAEEAYRRAVEIEPAVALILPPREITLTGLPEIVRLYVEGDNATAAELWDSNPITTVQGYVTRASIAVDAGDREAAIEYLSEAERIAYADDPPGRIWLEYGRAKLEGMQANFNIGLSDADYESGVNLARSQWLREVSARIFVPQVGYEHLDPMLIRLLQEEAD
jgi:putative inorganic carbon (hco3(-)) transporter